MGQVGDSNEIETLRGRNRELMSKVAGMGAQPLGFFTLCSKQAIFMFSPQS